MKGCWLFRGGFAPPTQEVDCGGGVMCAFWCCPGGAVLLTLWTSGGWSKFLG